MTQNNTYNPITTNNNLKKKTNPKMQSQMNSKEQGHTHERKYPKVSNVMKANINGYNEPKITSSKESK